MHCTCSPRICHTEWLIQLRNTFLVWFWRAKRERCLWSMKHRKSRNLMSSIKLSWGNGKVSWGLGNRWRSLNLIISLQLKFTSSTITNCLHWIIILLYSCNCFQALEEEFARQRAEQERFYGGNYSGANGDGDNKSTSSYPTASLQRTKKGASDANRHSTVM